MGAPKLLSIPLSPSKLAGITYILGKVASGNVVVGIGDTLVELAETVGTTSTSLSYAFLFQGCGMLLAVPYIPTLYRRFNGDHVTFVSMAVISLLWPWGARISSESTLYVWFFVTGLTAAVLDTGTQIQVRREFGDCAGPWLTALSFAFKGAGLYAPMLSYVAADLTTQYLYYFVISAAMAAVAFWNILDRRRRSLLQDATAAAAGACGNGGSSVVGSGSGSATEAAAPQKAARKSRSAAKVTKALVELSHDLLERAPAGTTGAKTLDSAAADGFSSGDTSLDSSTRSTSRSSSRSYSCSFSSDEEDRCGAGAGAGASRGYEHLPADAENSGNSGAPQPNFNLKRLSFGAAFFQGAYKVDSLLMVMVFAGIGAQCQCSSYLETFVIDTSAAAKSQASLMLSVFWGSMLFSNILALFRQLKTSAETIFLEIYGLCLFGAISALPLVWGGVSENYQPWQVWCAIVGWGLAFGPMSGYIYDLHNRICDNMEEGPAMLMFGLNLGSSFVPAIMLQIWNAGVGPGVLPIALVVGMTIVAMLNSGLPIISSRLREGLQAAKEVGSGGKATEVVISPC